ncbi:MAG: ABC transporter substrate-binding protein [Fluviicola sp.]|nr:ABC transporter substrate-binding protein [Fluviicola sp.]
MSDYVDQMNQTFRLVAKPRRIVSLVPSQTELLYELGLEKEVVGITKFCIHPKEWFHSKNRVGGTKTIDIEKVKALKPDLIIGNKEENEQADIEALKEIAPVWMSDIFNLEDALQMIDKIGELTGTSSESSKLQDLISKEFSKLKARTDSITKKTVLYFIWNEPSLVAGKNTFIDDMLSKCGFENLCAAERYPKLDNSLQPDLVLLSSEPYPFKEEHLAKFKEKYPRAEIKIVDGEMFSWYGSRLKNAPDYFRELLSND